MAKIKWQPVPDMIGWNRLKSLRENRGVSQPQLAVGANVAVTTIYFLENGFEERIGEAVKKRIADFFEVDVEDIFPAQMVGDEPRDVFIERMKAEIRARKSNARP